MITGSSPFLQDLAICGLPVVTLALLLWRGACRRSARRTLAERFEDDKGEALTLFHKEPRP